MGGGGEEEWGRGRRRTRNRKSFRLSEKFCNTSNVGVLNIPSIVPRLVFLHVAYVSTKSLILETHSCILK